jgi:hypothetical protein
MHNPKFVIYSSLIFTGAGFVLPDWTDVPFCNPTTTLCRPEAIVMQDDPAESLPRQPQPPPPSEIGRPAYTSTVSSTTAIIWSGWPPKV